MNAVFSFFKGIVDLGAAVMLPIVLIIIGLFFRMKLGQAIESGLMVGIGFQGLCLVVNLLTTSIQPVIKYYQSMGGGFTTTDLGFAAVGAASWSVPFAPVVLPLIIILNLILLKLKLTKVMNVDIWNYIHFIIPGAMAYALTDSIAVGVVVTLAASALALFLGQIVAKPWQEFFGLEGTTCSTLSYIGTTFPLATLFNKIIDCIPGLNKIDVNMDKIESKLGFFGRYSSYRCCCWYLIGYYYKAGYWNNIINRYGSISSADLNPKNGNSYDGGAYSFRKCCKCLYEE